MESTHLNPGAPVKVAAWMVIVIVARELAITGMRLLAAAKKTVIAADNFGKFKTILQIVTIIALLITDAVNEWSSWLQNLFRPWVAGFAEICIVVDGGADGGVRFDLSVAQPRDLFERRLIPFTNGDPIHREHARSGVADLRFCLLPLPVRKSYIVN